MQPPHTPEHIEITCDVCGALWWRRAPWGVAECPSCGAEKRVLAPGVNPHWGTTLEQWLREEATAAAAEEVIIEMRRHLTMYQRFLHLLCVASDAGKVQTVTKLLDNAARWSYAHRPGNGTLTAAETRELVAEAFDRLCNVD